MFAEHLTQEPFHSPDSDTVGGVQPQDSGLKCQRWRESGARAHMRVKRRAVHSQNKRNDFLLCNMLAMEDRCRGSQLKCLSAGLHYLPAGSGNGCTAQNND